MLKHCSSLAILMVLQLPAIPAHENTPSQKPRVGSISIVGGASFEQGSLLKQLRMMAVGATYHPGQLEADVELNLRTFLRDHGYWSNEVRWQAEPGPGGNVDIRIEVSEGLRYRLGKLELAGETAFTEEQIRNLFDLREGDILDGGKIKSALDQLKHMYSDRGYINWSYLPETNPEGTVMNLKFTIVEDKQFRTGIVGFVGCGDQEEEDRVRSAVSLRPGEIFSMSKVEASISAINSLGSYRVIGEADVVMHPDDKNGLIAVVFWLKPKA